MKPTRGAMETAKFNWALSLLSSQQFDARRSLRSLTWCASQKHRTILKAALPHAPPLDAFLLTPFAPLPAPKNPLRLSYRPRARPEQRDAPVVAAHFVPPHPDPPRALQRRRQRARSACAWGGGDGDGDGGGDGGEDDAWGRATVKRLRPATRHRKNAVFMTASTQRDSGCVHSAKASNAICGNMVVGIALENFQSAQRGSSSRIAFQSHRDSGAPAVACFLRGSIGAFSARLHAP